METDTLRHVSVSIVYITKRPGTYDVLFNSLAAQTLKDYELICIDELVAFRREAVENHARKVGVPLKAITNSKPKPESHPFGYCNAMNTGLMKTTANLVVMLQDYAWLPATFIERVKTFYRDHSRSLLGFPEVFYLAPEEYVDTMKLSDDSALSIFSTPLTKSPEELGWQVEQDLNPSDVRPDYHPHWFWECYCCAAPWSVYEELNGFDETLDMGDDCHERNIRDRARLIGYDSWIDGRSVVQQIKHRSWQDNLLWHRRPEDSNIRDWNARLEKIKRGEYPFKSPNGFELVR